MPFYENFIFTLKFHSSITVIFRHEVRRQLKKATAHLDDFEIFQPPLWYLCIIAYNVEANYDSFHSPPEFRSSYQEFAGILHLVGKAPKELFLAKGAFNKMSTG